MTITFSNRLIFRSKVNKLAEELNHLHYLEIPAYLHSSYLLNDQISLYPLAHSLLDDPITNLKLSTARPLHSPDPSTSQFIHITSLNQPQCGITLLSLVALQCSSPVNCTFGIFHAHISSTQNLLIASFHFLASPLCTIHRLWYLRLTSILRAISSPQHPQSSIFLESNF